MREKERTTLASFCTQLVFDIESRSLIIATSSKIAEYR